MPLEDIFHVLAVARCEYALVACYREQLVFQVATCFVPNLLQCQTVVHVHHVFFDALAVTPLLSTLPYTCPWFAAHGVVRIKNVGYIRDHTILTIVAIVSALSHFFVPTLERWRGAVESIHTH